MGTTKLLAPLLLAAAAFFAGSAQAAYTTFFGEDPSNSDLNPLLETPNSDKARGSFLSKLINVGTETFEGKDPVASDSLTLVFPGSTVTATLTGVNGGVTKVPTGTTDKGRYSVPSSSTTNFWNASAVPGAENSDSTFTIAFDSAIAAFGFYGVDIGDFGGQLELLLFGKDGQQVGPPLTVPNKIGSGGSTTGSVLYFGLIAQDPSDLFTSIRFRMTATTADTDVFAFDNFTIAEPTQIAPPGNVPESGTLALAGAALLAAGAARRRRHT